MSSTFFRSPNLPPPGASFLVDVSPYDTVLDDEFFDATVAATATLAATQAAQTAAAAAAVLVTGTSSSSQAGQGCSSSAGVAIRASCSIAEAPDTLAAAGIVSGAAVIVPDVPVRLIHPERAERAAPATSPFRGAGYPWWRH